MVLNGNLIVAPAGFAERNREELEALEKLGAGVVAVSAGRVDPGLRVALKISFGGALVEHPDGTSSVLSLGLAATRRVAKVITETPTYHWANAQSDCSWTDMLAAMRKPEYGAPIAAECPLGTKAPEGTKMLMAGDKQIAVTLKQPPFVQLRGGRRRQVF